MGKLHELLAVESAIAGNYARDRDETVKVFDRPAASSLHPPKGPMSMLDSS